MNSVCVVCLASAQVHGCIRLGLASNDVEYQRMFEIRLNPNQHALNENRLASPVFFGTGAVKCIGYAQLEQRPFHSTAPTFHAAFVPLHVQGPAPANRSQLLHPIT